MQKGKHMTVAGARDMGQRKGLGSPLPPVPKKLSSFARLDSRGRMSPHEPFGKRRHYRSVTF